MRPSALVSQRAATPGARLAALIEARQALEQVVEHVRAGTSVEIEGSSCACRRRRPRAISTCDAASGRADLGSTAPRAAAAGLSRRARRQRQQRGERQRSRRSAGQARPAARLTT